MQAMILKASSHDFSNQDGPLDFYTHNFSTSNCFMVEGYWARMIRAK